MDQIRTQVLTFLEKSARPKPMSEVAFSLNRNPTTEVSVLEMRLPSRFFIVSGRVND
jgi:hypothetical protein